MTPAKAPRKRVLTPNQVVAYNLRRARELRELTQEEAAERLHPFLGGERWSKATWSAAEASREPGAERIRQFDADEIVAFARAFGLPITWFFFPPDEDTPIASSRSTAEPLSGLDLFHAGSPGAAIEEVGDRIREAFPDRGPTEWHEDVGATLTRAFIQAAMARGMGKLPDFARLLRAVADDAPRLQLVAGFLESLERAAAEELAAMFTPTGAGVPREDPQPTPTKRARRGKGKR